MQYENSWSLQELISAFKELIYQEFVPLKIFFLIDGLDEFEGDIDDIIGLFQDIAASKNVKVCLSSRPWVVFEDSFAHLPNLRLQNLTYRDIKIYVTDRCTQNRGFQRLMSREPDSSPVLINEIVRKADGVFLWVKLVVESLLTGIKNRDELEDLRQRLRLLPKELKPLYAHLLSLIDSIYLPWVSGTFQILRTNRHLGDNPFGRAVPEREFNPLRSSRKDPQFRRTECENIAAQLTARCAGFLEVSTSNRNGNISTKIGPDSFVQYFHRTARDFIESESCLPKLLSYTSKTEFNPNVTMMMSCILHLHIRASLGENEHEFLGLAEEVLIYAHHADNHTASRDVQVVLLNQMCTLLNKYYIDWLAGMALHCDGINDFLKVVAIYNLTGYVATMLARKGGDVLELEASELLLTILPRDVRYVTYILPLPSISVVSLLISMGADINRSSPTDLNSPWQNLLLYAVEDLRNHDEDNPNKTFRRTLHVWRMYIKVIHVFVMAEADKHAEKNCPEYGIYNPVEVIRMVAKILPRAASPILQILKQASDSERTNGTKEEMARSD